MSLFPLEFFLLKNNKIEKSNLESEIKVSDLQFEIINISFGISTYWAELGIEWLEENEINSELEKRLKKLIENKMYSQKFRHKAFSKVKRYERIKKAPNKV